MFGSSSIINEVPHIARSLENSTMIGTGLTPEGINQNYFIYELMTEAAWRTTPSNLTEWTENYTTRRYGLSDDNAQAAWRILQRTIYDVKMITYPQYMIVHFPNFQLSVENLDNTQDLFHAWSLLLEASDNLRKSSAYLHNLVDVTSQVFQVYGDMFYNGMRSSYNGGDFHSFDYYGITLLDMFIDLDLILSTNEAFLLGRWIQSAKDVAADVPEEQQFEFNARNQITLWGPAGVLRDYAAKQWAGIVSDYFAPRWQLFIEHANMTLISGQSFNQSYISERIFEGIERPFSYDNSTFATESIGDAVEIVPELYKKWSPTLKLIHD